ncbi:MAG: pirin family protein [Gammaproteobacteria bacterium]|nr:MAG: pirin family protein [Gammaproteobacteria bacterium]
MKTSRYVSRILKGMATSDGAGVELTRVIGTPQLEMLDPFLLLDVFRSDDPNDYIAGFPAHPHRGFETITYLLNGRMRHRDSAGHEGVIGAGDIQWMSAGRGIVHSEMPEQQDGLLAGFQLWVNLPASHKMSEPAYQEFGADKIPVEIRDNGTKLKVITGTTQQGTRGPVHQPLTDPLYIDVTVPAGEGFSESLPHDYSAFVFLFEGSAGLLDRRDANVTLHPDELAVLSHGETVALQAGDHGARFLLLSGKPLHEPVARGGPFVMNNKEEIKQAFEDYNNNKF